MLLRIGYGGLYLVLAGYLVSLLVRSSGVYWTWLDGWVVCGIELTASALCIAKGVIHRPWNRSALVLGLGLVSWAIGDLILTTQSIGGADAPSPSWSDLFYLGFYPLAYVAVVMIMRGEVRRPSVLTWLDGAIAGLGAAAVCAAFAFRDILKDTGTDVAATVTNLAYPIGDLLLLGLVIGGSAMLSGKRRAPWILLASGLALNAVGDTSNLLQRSLGASRFGTVFNGIAWPTATVVISMAVWLRNRPTNPLLRQRAAGFLLPNLFAASALAILLVAALHSVGRVAIALATATLAVVGVRLALSVQSIQSLSQERHRQSVTDDLTGLSNRRHLFRVLDEFFTDHGDSSPGDSRLAFLFVDLNHFKEINDSFGHAAGDELLRQLGPRMTRSLRDTDVLVRIGGDELAVVILDNDAAYAETVAQRLITELEQPFELDSVSVRIGASIGIASAPTDASDSAGLLRCAALAMYRAKLGSSSFETYRHEIDDGGNRLRLVEELRLAVASGRFEMNYHHLPASSLMLELTETTVIRDFDRCKLLIANLRDLGLGVSIDDFGAGFTSLASLGRLAVNELKLDRSFITDLAANGQDRDLALVRATIEFSHALEMRVVAEGIEDHATFALLASMGCDLAQGFFISRPVPARDLVLPTPHYRLLPETAIAVSA